MNSETKKKLLNMVNTGDYFLWLTEWKPKDGQYILVYTTDKGVSKGLPKGLVERHMVRVGGSRKFAKFDTSSGSAYKSGRFLVKSDSINKLLNR